MLDGLTVLELSFLCMFVLFSEFAYLIRYKMTFH